VEIPAGFEATLARGEPAVVKIFDYEGELRSGFAANELRNLFNDYREKTITARLVDITACPPPSSNRSR